MVQAVEHSLVLARRWKRSDRLPVFHVGPELMGQ
jgi:hypothetical protein